MVHVRLFAGAADAAGVDQCEVDAHDTDRLARALIERYGDRLARVLPQCSLLVDGVAAVGTHPLRPGSRVDVLPPFAGG